MYLKNIGMVIDTSKNLSIEVYKKIVEILIENNININTYPVINDKTLDGMDIKYVNKISKLVGDAVIAIGGDGTILRTFLFLKDKDMPVFGIGLGERNFLSCVSYNNYIDGIKRLIEGRVYLRQEMRLNIELENRDIEIPPILNEATFSTSVIGKTVYPYISINSEGKEEIIWMGKSDGVLISTPIGSTAYSLSAGGPVIDTDLEAILITPLLPVDRKPPLVISPDKTITVWASKKRNKPILVLDGQIKIEIDWEEKVYIKKSKYYANFIVINKSQSLTRLRKAGRQ